MAPSFMKKTMVYLGLLDDEYDEYDDLDSAPRGFSSATRVEPRPQQDYDQGGDEFSGGMSRVRTIPRESAVPSQARPQPSNMAPRPQAVRAMPVDTTISAMPAGTARVHVVAPSRFGDAKEIADRLKDSRPVIVNLQNADRDLQRRMIDFCSGVTYALSGEMEKVADQVFLLAPSNVKVSDEERQRLADRGFERD
jgi:cell division inhibitor SepF